MMASTTMESAEPAIRPLSMRSFRRDLDKFEKYIARITMQDSDASVDEKRQKINENLRYEPFCERIRKYFGPDIKTEDVKAIFRKISTNPDVKIDWSEVFGYFQAETEDGDGEEKSVFAVSKRKKIGEAAGDKKRRDIIQCITYSPEYDLYVTASQKGAISMYNGKLRLQSCIDVNEPAWMTSCAYLPRLRKVIATTERTIVIWDHRAKANNQSSIYVIKPLEHSPQCMCLLPPRDEHVDSVLIGDDAGFVNLVKFTPNDFATNSSNDPNRGMASQVIDPISLAIPIVRRKFHPDWVLKVEYLPDLKAIASCSPSDKNSFVISEFKRLFDTQPVSELSIAKGVNSFAYSEKSNIFATGGVDKIIRVWHPNILSRPTGKMLGHLFTIIAVVINDKDQHIISLSTARVFRVWDIHTLMCLQVFTDSETKSGDRRISCLLFDSRHDRLFTGSSSIDTWPMTRTVQDTMSVPHTHDHPLSVLIKNKAKNQVLTACSESVMKVWEVDTGRQMYQILEAHGMGIEVTAAAADLSGTRLASGAYDGSIKIWEFSSGQELKTYSLDPPREDDQTVMWMTYLPCSARDSDENQQSADIDETPQSGNANSVNYNKTNVAAEDQEGKKRILAVGWNNKVKEFEETPDDSTQLVFVREFSNVYEWPPTPQVTPEPSEFADEAERDDDDVTKSKKVINAGDETPVPRKEELLLRHEITCCSLMDDSVQAVCETLITGCSNGNVILWNHKKGDVENVFELEKAELPSRYDSRERRMKDQLPYRVNAVVGLCHRVYRPDPEELKKRRKLRKKKLQEMEEGIEDDQDRIETDAEDAPETQEKKENYDDPAEEMDIPAGSEAEDEDDDVKSFEERQLLEFDQEPIKMVRVDFPPTIASCHQDCNVRLWSMSGDLLLSMAPMTKVASPLTSVCHDENAEYLIVGDAKGYITMWNLSEFLQRPAATAMAANGELARQIICWRAHLMKIVALAYADDSGALISASTDGSVRIWYPQRGHYIGYLGQHRVWYLTQSPSLPSSPVLPYDINEVPLKPLNVKSNRKKTQTKKYDYPLIFDAGRWKPFRRSAYDRDLIQSQAILPDKDQPLNVLEVRNKKFFKALVKPKADKSSLESSKPAEPESGAIFRALPVYRLRTPPPHPKPPAMDFITGGSDWNDDEASNPKTPGKLGGAKGPRGKAPIKKPTQGTVSGIPMINIVSPKKKR